MVSNNKRYFIAYYPGDPEYWRYHSDLVDGILISQKNLHTKKGNPTTILKNMKEKGARKVLGIPENISLMVDSGAYQYASPNYDYLPTSPEKIMNLYKEIGADIGVHLDWPILPNLDNETIKKRYKITLENAAIMKELMEKEKYNHLDIIAVTQGITPKMHRESAKYYISLGYTYIGIGGLVPLLRFQTKFDRVYEIIESVLKVVKHKKEVRIHLFGMGNLNILKKYKFEQKIYSFDNATPTLAAIKGDIIFYNPHYQRFNIIKHRNLLNNKVPCRYCYACKQHGKNILNHGKREWNFGRAVHNYVHYKMLLNSIFRGNEYEQAN